MCMCIILGLLLSFVVYKYVRPFYPVKVNCWFCSTDAVVPYGNKNCWDCPACQQYNGFNEDGDYNKPIPTQYNGDLNHPVSCAQGDYISNNDVLCENCTRNQLLKTKQLAAFVPLNEANFDTEVTAFEGYLEKLYRLCPECQMVVNKELSKQDDILQQKLDTFYTEALPTPSEDSQIQVPEKSSSRLLMIGRLLEVASTVCALLLLLHYLSTAFSVHEHLRRYLRGYHQVVEVFLVSIESYRKLIGMLGLTMSIISKITVGKNRLRLFDALQIPLWLSVLFLLQENSTSPVFMKAEPILLLGNWLTSSLCLLSARKSRAVPNINIRRLSLDVSKSSSCPSDTSKGSVLYSASQVCGDQDEGSEVMEEESVNFDDTLSDLEAVSLGLPGSQRQKNSGMFSSSFTSVSQAPSNFSNRSVAHALKARRPLISPAKFSFSKQQRSSTPTKFQVSTTRSPFAVNRGPCLQAKSTNLFLPQPFQNGFQNGGSHLSASSSFHAPRSYDSGVRSRISEKFQYEESDHSDNSETKSEASRQTSICPVDSTTKQSTGFSFTRFLKSPGFIGFVLGASVIGNLALAVYVLRIS